MTEHVALQLVRSHIEQATPAAPAVQEPAESAANEERQRRLAAAMAAIERAQRAYNNLPETQLPPAMIDAMLDGIAGTAVDVEGTRKSKLFFWPRGPDVDTVFIDAVVIETLARLDVWARPEEHTYEILVCGAADRDRNRIFDKIRRLCRESRDRVIRQNMRTIWFQLNGAAGAILKLTFMERDVGMMRGTSADLVILRGYASDELISELLVPLLDCRGTHALWLVSGSVPRGDPQQQVINAAFETVELN